MIKKIKGGLNRRKVKIFLLFLVCALLAWFVSNLSETYTSDSDFYLDYVNVPDSLFFEQNSRKNIDLKLRTGGFQFLRFNFFKKRVEVDLSEAKFNSGKFYLPQSVFRKQIEAQLPSSVSLLEVGIVDTLFLDLYQLHTVEVPVISKIKLQLAQDYMLEDSLVVEPSRITISGPKEEIDSISQVYTKKAELSVTDSFEQSLMLDLPTGLKNSKFSTNKVLVKGEVFRFSEKIVKLPVEVVNLPRNMAIRTFPNEVRVLCKGRVEVLKNVNSSNFKLIADYSQIDDGISILKPVLKEYPRDLYSAKLMDTEVEFILNRK